MRKDLLAVGQVYHVFSRSIAKFVIFNNDDEFLRMKQLAKYYQIKNEIKFSNFLELQGVQKEGFNNFFNLISTDKEKLVQIIAYCLMPTHIHLVLKQLQENGISDYMKNVLNSYTRFFNSKHKRKGPLWEGRFKNVSVDKDEQLLHLTRYIHLNPVTAQLINMPEKWEYSSYKEYLSETIDSNSICSFKNVLEIKPPLYKNFVNNQIAYQKELSKIKKLVID